MGTFFETQCTFYSKVKVPVVAVRPKYIMQAVVVLYTW